MGKDGRLYFIDTQINRIKSDAEIESPVDNPKPDKPEPKKKNRIFTVWNNSSTNTEVG
jgi:hypothetical protein